MTGPLNPVNQDSNEPQQEHADERNHKEGDDRSKAVRVRIQPPQYVDSDQHHPEEHRNEEPQSMQHVTERKPQPSQGCKIEAADIEDADRATDDDQQTDCTTDQMSDLLLLCSAHRRSVLAANEHIDF